MSLLHQKAWKYFTQASIASTSSRPYQALFLIQTSSLRRSHPCATKSNYHGKLLMPEFHIPNKVENEGGECTKMMRKGEIPN